MIVRGCLNTEQWMHRGRKRGCRKLPDAKFGIECSCVGQLCNAETDLMMHNDYLVVRELYFESFFDINEDSSPVGGAHIG